MNEERTGETTAMYRIMNVSKKMLRSTKHVKTSYVWTNLNVPSINGEQ